MIHAQLVSPAPPNRFHSLKISRLSDERDRFPGVLDIEPLIHLRDNSFVIHNSDDRDIVAVYAIWTVIDRDGRARSHHYMWDIYNSVIPDRVLPSGEDIIISPLGWFSPRGFRKSRMAALAESEKLASFESLLKEESEISVALDAFIYSDGETCGENTSGIQRAIVARKEAASSLAARLRTSIAAGEDWRVVLQKSQSLVPTDDKGTTTFWEQLWAGALLGAQDDPELNLRIEYLEKLPKVPSFSTCRSDEQKP